MAYYKVKVFTKNVWWNQSYNDAYHFKSITERTNFFNNNFDNVYNSCLNAEPIYNFNFGNGLKTTFTHFDDTVDVKTLINANYLMVIYSPNDVNYVPFFYFIDNVSIENGNEVTYSLTLDVMTTYLPGVDYNFNNFMCTRKHFDRFTSDSTKTAAKFDFTKEFNRIADPIESDINSKFYKDLKTIVYSPYNRTLTQSEQNKANFLNGQKWIYLYVSTEPLQTDDSIWKKIANLDFDSTYKTNFGAKCFPYQILCLPFDTRIKVKDINNAEQYDYLYPDDIRYFTQSANILANIVCNIPPYFVYDKIEEGYNNVEMVINAEYYDQDNDYYFLEGGVKVTDQVADKGTENEIHFRAFDLTSLWESYSKYAGQQEFSLDNELLDNPVINLNNEDFLNCETKYYSRGSFNQYELKNYQNNSFAFDLAYMEKSKVNFKRISSMGTIDANSFETITNAPVNFNDDYVGIAGKHFVSLTCLSDAWTQYQATNKNFMQTGLAIPIAEAAVNAVTGYVTKGTMQRLAMKQATYGNIMHGYEDNFTSLVNSKFNNIGVNILSPSKKSIGASKLAGFNPFDLEGNTAAIVGSTAVGAAANFAVSAGTTIANFSANINNIQNSPDTIKLQGSSFLDFFVKSQGLRSFVKHSELRDADKKVVCQYFHDYGYSYNQIQRNFSDLFVRESFNYVETQDSISKIFTISSFNDIIKSVIASIYDKGIRLWEASSVSNRFNTAIPNIEKRFNNN